MRIRQKVYRKILLFCGGQNDSFSNLISNSLSKDLHLDVHTVQFLIFSSETYNV